jgi:flagellar hook-associated protein 1
MTSTFMGLEISKRGMSAQQSALYVTSQNVANASTPGYSRQRVNFEQTEPYPGPGFNRAEIPGQMGTGVTAGTIQRIRDSFLDVQYRTENNKVGYYQSRSDALDQMQSIINEPSDSGLSNTMDQFWQALQDLAADPTNSGARSVVQQRGEAVANTFNYLSSSLTAVKNDQKDQIDVNVKNINSILDQVNALNQQIGRVEPNGLLPNDLYDERDKLIDQLSSLVNIKVNLSASKPAGNANPLAEGQITIDLVDDNGKQLGTLLSPSGPNKLQINYDKTNGAVNSVSIGTSLSLNFSDMNSSGKLRGLIEAYGYKDSKGQITGMYPDMLNKLDNLAYTFAQNFNAVQTNGLSPDDISSGTKNTPPFFTDENNNAITAVSDKMGLAGRITVSTEIQNSINGIATASGTDPKTATLGDSSNAYNLANAINTKYDYNGTGELTDFRSYYQNVIGGMGVDAQEANRLATNSTTLQQSVDEKRQSVSSVSLDEEMTNMIQYQHAYTASAKMMNIQDQLLDTIINGLGAGK